MENREKETKHLDGRKRSNSISAVTPGVLTSLQPLEHLGNPTPLPRSFRELPRGGLPRLRPGHGAAAGPTAAPLLVHRSTPLGIC